jgi:hypothetical protein
LAPAYVCRTGTPAARGLHSTAGRGSPRAASSAALPPLGCRPCSTRPPAVASAGRSPRPRSSRPSGPTR